MEKSIDVSRAVSIKLKNGANDNMNVNGSVTPVTFEAKPPAGKKWRLIRALIYMESGTNFSAEKFAHLVELANGVENKINGVTITTWKTNRDLALEMHDLNAPTALAKEAKSVSGRWSFDKAFGSMVLVNADDGGVQVVINDDLSALDAFYVTIQGQVV